MQKTACTSHIPTLAVVAAILFPVAAARADRGLDVDSTSFPSGGHPFAIVATDLNADGLVDLAVTNFVPATISIHLGRGDGSFEPPSVIATGPQPRGLVAADFNEDGIVDLAVVAKGANAVQLHLGTGNGQFKKAGSFAVEKHPFMLEEVDLDRDGHLDLVVSNEGETAEGRALSVLKGDGTGRFTVQSFSSGKYGSDVAVADYNKDGNADVAITTWGSNDVNVHLGRGDATFAPPSSFTYDGRGHGLYRVLAADLDRDGNADMVWNDLQRSGLYVLYGDGKGDFPRRLFLSTDHGVRHALAGDLNGDEWLDLVSANTGAGNISVVLSDGKGGFLPAQNFPAGEFPRTVALADFDRDGRLDFAVTNLRSNEIRVFLNRGAAPLQTAAPDPTPPNPKDAVPLELSSFRFPNGISLAPGGQQLLVADQQNHRIARVDIASGAVTTLAGTGEPGDSGDGGLAIQAGLRLPSDAVMDTHGNVYIADFGNNRIRRVDTKGIITTVAGEGVDAGDNGAATRADLNHPFALALDRTNRLYIADLGNHRIRRVDPMSGTITTVAGTGTQGASGDGGPASKATFGAVTDLTFDEAGNLFVVDQFNFRIRKISTDGTVETVAGSGHEGFGGDGGPALEAQLHYPSGVTVDRSGIIYIADQDGDRIRKVTRDGIITTISGEVGKRGYRGDGGPASEALIWFPSHLTIDAAGNIFFTDRFNHCIRKIDSSGIISTVAGEPSTETVLYSPIDATLDVAALVADGEDRAVAPHTPPTLEWEHVFQSGSDANAAYAVSVDEDGAIYVAGDVGTGATWRVMRFDSNGKSDWNFEFDGGSVEIPEALTLTPDGQVVSAGTVRARRYRGPLVISLSPQGEESWRYEPVEKGRRIVHGVASDAQSNLYLAGASDANWEVTGLTARGEARWTHSDKRGSANGVDVDGRGDVLAVGSEPDVWRVVKLSADGNLIWEHRVGTHTHGPSPAVAYGVRVDSAGNTIVTGSLRGPSQRLRVEKLGPGGKLLWEYLEPGEAGVSVGRSVDVDSEGNAVVVGEVGNDWLMLSLNPEGKLLWRSTYDGGGGDENKDQALSVRLTDTGSIVVAGVQHPVPAKFPSLGAVEWRIARYSWPAAKKAR